MTDEQMRIAIAEACGWKALEYEDFSKYGVPCFMLMGSNNTGTRLVPPDYLNDLNAMHEAERMLPVAQWDRYTQWLGELAKGTRRFVVCHATARQRCIAFLKTLNLWKD